MQRPTLIDVARVAGVSRATASRVLAGATTVDSAMVDAVNAAAHQLGYRTNTAARSLRAGRTGSVGLVLAASELDAIGGSFVALPLRGATSVLSAARVQTVLMLTKNGETAALADYLGSRPVDGVIVILQHEISEVVASLRALELPIVFVGRPGSASDSELWFADADNYGGARSATAALVERGRRRIATISGPLDMEAATARTQGWRDELLARHTAPGAVAEGDFTLSGGAAAMTRLLAADPEIDGVFAASDLMALGAVRVLRAAGRRVPHDVSVIGFDDAGVAAASEPPLTSVRQPFEEMGRAAAEMILAATRSGGEANRGGAAAQQRVLPTELVRRASV